MLCHLAALALLGAAPADAARVSTLQGTATIEHRHPGGTPEPARVGSIVHEGDGLRTAANSAVSLSLMRDGATVDLGARTTFEVKSFRREGGGALVQLKLIAGRLWAAVSRGGGEFQVTTDNAVAGVRGTEFGVAVNENGSTDVTVLSGQVEVTGSGGTPTMVGALQQGTVGSDGSVSVKNVTAEEVAAAAPKVEPAKEEITAAQVEEPVEAVSDSDKLEAARAAVAQMKAILAKVLKHLSDARDEGDVVKLNCVNEKLTAIKGLLKIAEQSDVVLQEALARRDTESAQHEFEKVSIAKRKCEQLLAESEACVGELAVYAGDTEVALELDESITTSDPSEYVIPPVVVERPPAASPFQ